MEGYLSIREAAEKWGVSQRRINQYCAEGRIPGAERFGGSWAIPENARKPGDPSSPLINHAELFLRSLKTEYEKLFIMLR